MAYWLATSLYLVPLEWAFKDYADPTLVAWNWSFFPLDLLISANGLYALWRSSHDPDWRGWALVSLSLTLAAGLNGNSFWAIRGDFALAWWIPNLYLLLYPLYFIPKWLTFAPRG
nr:DUF5360 family protein [Allomeiothermus silvanus]